MSGIELSRFDFETARMHLRPLRADDESFFTSLYGNAESMRYIGAPLSASQASSRCRRMVAASRALPATGFSLVMVDKASAQRVGMCGASRFAPNDRRIEAGILLQPQAQSRGLGREALAALVGRIFAELPVDEIMVHFSRENRIVERLNLSLGFAPCVDGRFAVATCPDQCWSVLRRSWPTWESMEIEVGEGAGSVASAGAIRGSRGFAHGA